MSIKVRKVLLTDEDVLDIHEELIFEGTVEELKVWIAPALNRPTRYQFWFSEDNGDSWKQVLK